MKKEFFDLQTQNMASLDDGGVQKACYVITEWNNSRNYPDYCAVTEDEYKEAVRILVAYAHPRVKDNTTVETYRCVHGCDDARSFCGGNFCLSLRPNKKECPYLVDDPGE